MLVSRFDRELATAEGVRETDGLRECLSCIDQVE